MFIRGEDWKGTERIGREGKGVERNGEEWKGKEWFITWNGGKQNEKNKS